MTNKIESNHMAERFIGTFMREPPCKKCGGKEFYHCSRSCVQCDRARKKGKGKAGTQNGGRKARAKPDATGVVNSMLSAKW